MNEIKIEFTSEMENIRNIRNMVASLVVGYEQTISFMNELKTIVSEGITNAIIHGYEGKNDGIIILTVKMDENGIYITIEDNGIGIEDVKKAREVLYSTKKESDRSGLGFTVMELFSTTLLVDSKLGEGTKLSIFKKWD